ncbi:PfkB domain protein [Kribbella flavida DSM 17836]|uniref:Deoxyribokinase n=1 Tax=Kribbella flavida (strain DSM 17836 / JCM 10339 / NBRC 14399) TaxID=479435 RepID=D2PN42_KRIFD|nr:ribokinase [Kribbella flavida]ADB34526.1 PfkB domain protein [Kribbella flavida DSM 17836]
MTGPMPRLRRTRYDVCVLGSFMKDLVASADRRPLPGETLHGTAFAEFLGGKGVNQAIAAARMGARTAIVGTIGADRYGEEFLDLLTTDGVDTGWVVRHPELGTGVGLPLVLPDGSNSIIIVSRANAAITPADIEAAGEVLTGSRVLSVQLELPVEASRAALRLASAAGVTTILTPAPVGPVDASLTEYVDILVPNEVEAAALTGLDCDDESQVPAIARKLADEWDLRGCVVTLGSRGAFVLDRTAGVELRVAPHRVATVDTVGAGDAFCGSLAASLAEGAPLTDAVRLANAAGALSTTVNGAAASAPGRAEAEDLLGSVLVGGAPETEASPLAVAPPNP